MALGSGNAEHIFLDAVERASRSREGRFAVEVTLGDLTRNNADAAQLRMAHRLFDPLVTNFRCQIFPMVSGDVVIMGKDVPKSEIEAVLRKLFTLFDRGAALTEAQQAKVNVSKFTRWYDLEYDYDPLLKRAREMERVAREKRIVQQTTDTKPGSKPVITPDGLARLIHDIAKKDLAGLIRRQAIVSVTNEMQATIAFNEYHLAMGDLQRHLAPDMNILGDKWLFQHFSQTLDMRMLPMIEHIIACQKTKGISLNLNLASVATETFIKFLESLDDSQHLIVEVQVIDAFQDVALYKRAQDILHNHGQKILIDGLDPMTMNFLELGPLRANLYKILWNPALTDGTVSSARKAQKMLSEQVKPEQLILGRVDSEQAVRWGLFSGIRAFQGRFLDAMLNMKNTQVCMNDQNCKHGTCVVRAGIRRPPQGARGGQRAGAAP